MLVRPVAVVLLTVFLLASLGLIPSPSMVFSWLGRKTQDRYPCEGCGCGCASAAECWTHCCCHSEHERLVWALEHGVLPPVGVRISDEQWIAAANAVRPGSAHCSACVDRLQRDLASSVSLLPVAARPASDACCDGGHAAGDDNPARGLSRSFGPRASGLACKGVQGLIALAIGPMRPEPGVIDLIPACEAPPQAAEASASPLASRALDIPEPPPRRR